MPILGMRKVRTLTVEVLLPALCLCPSNLGLVNEVWGMLSLQPATDRWAMYAALKVRFHAQLQPLFTYIKGCSDTADVFCSGLSHARRYTQCYLFNTAAIYACGMFATVSCNIAWGRCPMIPRVSEQPADAC